MRNKRNLPEAKKAKETTDQNCMPTSHGVNENKFKPLKMSALGKPTCVTEILTKAEALLLYPSRISRISNQ